MYIRSSSLLLAALTLACSNPADDKPKASVAEPEAKAAAAAPEQAAAPAGAIAFTHDHGTVAFLGSKVSGKESGGTFDRFSGHFVIDGDAVKAARVEIDMTSVTTAKDKLTKHLRSSDFFDVPNHPKALFVTKAITAREGDAKATHTVKGDLTLRGVTKAIEFPATIAKKGADYELSAEFSFDRQPFGVAYVGGVDDLIRDEVVMTLKLKAPAGA